jgi:hypothetical protein
MSVTPGDVRDIVGSLRSIADVARNYFRTQPRRDDAVQSMANSLASIERVVTGIEASNWDALRQPIAQYHRDHITLPKEVVIAVARALSAYQFDNPDADINGGDLVQGLTESSAAERFCDAVVGAGILLPEWREGAIVAVKAIEDEG